MGTKGGTVAAGRIRGELLNWPNVVAEPHRFGGVEFKVGRRELGHLHGGHLVDLPFPKRIRDQLIAAGRAETHHVLPETGWVSFPIRSEADIERAIELFRLNYERPWLFDGKDDSE
jgi:luciferase-like monooxygenase